MTQGDEACSRLLERAGDELAVARYAIANAILSVCRVAPDCFIVARLHHVEQELLLIGAFLSGLEPVK